MELSDNGASFIQGFEQLCLTSYPDQKGIPTIGWGHTGPEVALGQTCTLQQAEDWFAADTADAVREVNETITVPLTQNQFDALVSFTFNVGDHAESKSTLARVLNAGNYAAAAAEFPRWDHVGTGVSAGLERRRIAEQTLFNS